MPPAVHLINPLHDASGGSEWRAISLYNELKPHTEVRLWSTAEPDPRLADKFPIERITAGNHPKEGVFVIVGVWFGVGAWIRAARPSRIVLMYNTVAPQDLRTTYRALNGLGFYNIEMVFASKMVADSAEGLDGVIQRSPIDIKRFSPSKSRPPGSFTVGRLSRDVPEKHHATDPTLYRDLVSHGCRVRIMGGTCLRSSLSGVKDVELLPALAEPAEQFLQSLDCFFYRTRDGWMEAYGRVIYEALACGLPVVAHRSGGYRDDLSSGQNGFLFETKDQALRQILRLQTDRKLRQSVCRAARETAERLYGPDARQETLDFYLRPS